MNDLISFLDLFSRYSPKLAQGLRESAFSKILLKKFGILKATKKTSAKASAPINLAKKLYLLIDQLFDLILYIETNEKA